MSLHNSEVVVFRGPRVAVGCVTGRVIGLKACTRTGRAEYFGPILNHAARLSQAAHGGQVLVDEETRHECGEKLPRSRLHWNSGRFLR